MLKILKAYCSQGRQHRGWGGSTLWTHVLRTLYATVSSCQRAFCCWRMGSRAGSRLNPMFSNLSNRLIKRRQDKARWHNEPRKLKCIHVYSQNSFDVGSQPACLCVKCAESRVIQKALWMPGLQPFCWNYINDSVRSVLTRCLSV